MSLGRWYAQTYRLACEPAHISDLLDFMPPTAPEKTVLTREERAAALRCYLALDHSITIMLILAGRLHQGGLLDVVDPLKSFWARLEKIRPPSPSASSPAEQGGVFGVISTADGPEWEVFRETLRALGYTEGRNLAFEYRWHGGKVDALRPWRLSW